MQRAVSSPVSPVQDQLEFSSSSGAVVGRYVRCICAMFARPGPRLAQGFFTCQQCRGALGQKGLGNAYTRRSLSWLPFQNSLRSGFRRPSIRQVGGPSVLKSVSSPFTTSAWRRVIEGDPAKVSRFPETSSKIVAYWLLGSAASVFGIVVFGGLTRLTESG